jgi:hypothetical protein
MTTMKAATTMNPSLLDKSISESLTGSEEPGGQQHQSQEDQNQLQGFDLGLANAPGVGLNNGFENSNGNGNGFGTSIIKVDGRAPPFLMMLVKGKECLSLSVTDLRVVPLLTGILSFL